MFTRRFKQHLARLCIALLCMQAVVAAYACPAFLGDIQPAAVVAVAHADEKPMSGDCEQQQRAASTAEKNMCHQHYAGNQSVGTITLGTSAAAPPLPLTIVAVIAPVMPNASTALPVLLQRNTAPPLSIRFQVLRI